MNLNFLPTLLRIVSSAKLKDEVEEDLSIEEEGDEVDINKIIASHTSEEIELD